LDAAWSLAQRGDFSGRDVMIEALESEPLTAAEMLGRIGAPWSVDALSTLLRHPDPGVRNEAILGLARTNRTAAVPALIDALEDPDEERREDARVALVSLVGPRIAQVLASDGASLPGERRAALDFWRQNAPQFPGDVAIFEGRPLAIGEVLAEAERSSPAVAEALIDLILIWSGAQLSEGTTAERLQELRAWWDANRARFQTGRRYFFGHLV
jgi:HEAT repeat protein